MKLDEVIKLVSATRCVVLAEFRRGSCEVVKYNDKRGERKSFARVTLDVEFDGRPLSVSFRAPEGVDSLNYAPPAKRGQRIAIEFIDIRDAGSGSVYLEPRVLGVVE